MTDLPIIVEPSHAAGVRHQALTADDVEQMVAKLRPIVIAQGRHL